MNDDVKRYTPEQLRERAAQLRAVAGAISAESPGVAAIVGMDAWALNVVAELLTEARRIIDENPRSATLTDDERAGAAVMVCEGIAEGNLGAVLN